MIAAAAIVVMQSAEQNWVSAAIFSAALLALLKFKIEVAWIIPVAGILGFLAY
jgi:chromate transporter